MKRFYTESGILVCEWEEFEQSILFGKHGLKFTPEQWKNRKIGRTKLKPEDRMAMLLVLENIRHDRENAERKITKRTKPTKR